MKPKEKIKATLDRLRTETDPKFAKEMNAIADSFERLMKGAAKGGRSRARKLSKKRKKEIASKAGKARWANQK